MKTRLFLNYYISPHPERQKELDYCLNMNQNNPYIDKIYVLADAHVPATTTVVFTGRPTFNHFFMMVNENVGDEDITIIANSDIYFDHSLAYTEKMMPDDAFALSRHDLKMWDSQDAWIFKGKIREVNADFGMGMPGCDNRLAHELDLAGYRVSNPSYTINAIHVHGTNIRHYDQSTPKVDRPYLLVQPCFIGQQSNYHRVA